MALNTSLCFFNSFLHRIFHHTATEAVKEQLPRSSIQIQKVSKDQKGFLVVQMDTQKKKLLKKQRDVFSAGKNGCTFRLYSVRE